METIHIFYYYDLTTDFKLLSRPNIISDFFFFFLIIIRVAIEILPKGMDDITRPSG